MDSSQPPQPTGLSNTNHSTHQYQTFVTAEPEVYESTEDSQTRRAWKSALSIPTLPVADEDDDSDSEDEYGPTSRQRLKRNTVSPLLLPSTPVPEHRPTVRASLIARLQLSSIQKNILKCAVAYFIASLFTFNKTLASFLGQPFDIEGATPNAHFIATVSVYYNPAKSVGSMLEADLFMLWAAAFAVFGCLGSMATAVWLNRAGCELLSHTIVLTFWLAGSCGFLAFMKHRVNKPSFGSPCSMAALILSVVITKEGAVHLGNWEGGVILQLLWIIVIGTLISNLVCFLLFRGSATTLLQANVNKTLDSFATLLVMLTKAFLLEEDATISPERLQRATSAHEASFTSLKVAFDEAKLELLDPRIHRGVGLYDACIASMSRLAKHITGLREGCRSQDALLQERKAKRQDLEQTIITSSQTESQPEFEVFEQHVGPPLRSLIVTCKAALKEMRSVFVHSSAGQKEKASLANDSGRLQSLRDALKDDLQTFSVAHAVILKRLYREYPASTESSSFDASQAGDYVFTFYFFLHSLESLVRELDRLLQIFIRLHEVEVTLEHRRDIFVKRFGTYLGSFIFGLDFWNDGKGVHSQPQRWKQFRARLWKLNPLTTSDNPFRDIRHLDESQQLPSHEGLSYSQRAALAIWKTFKRFDDVTFKFAFKTGLGAGVLCLPAFIYQTRPLWRAYRGEWALISYMASRAAVQSETSLTVQFLLKVVAASSVGQSNFNTFFRIFGTLGGAAVALVAYHLTGSHPTLLAIFGFFFSLPNFWLIVARPRWATTGRFVLLTYNLTALYAFNKKEEDVPIGLIAARRSTAVVVGSLWAWLISVGIWPYMARRELRTELAGILMNCAHLYQRVLALYLTPPQPREHPNHQAGSFSMGEQQPLLQQKQDASDRDTSEDNDFDAKELFLQRKVLQMNTLLYQATLEPQLKGPFPMAIYQNILINVQGILDQLHLIKSVATREEWMHVRRDFVQPVQPLRREMVGNVLLHFSILASSRNRLVAAIRELEVVKRRQVKHSSTYLLYFAYALAMRDLIERLENIADLTHQLFGVTGGQESAREFESLFAAAEVESMTPPGTA